MSLRSSLLALAAGLLALAPLRATDLPAQLLPIYGGGGGTSFSRDCGAGKVLTGLRYRRGLVFDAIGLLCRPVNADGLLGSETTVGTLAGGTGGTAYAVSCAAGKVVVGSEIYHGTYVDGFWMYCRDWVPATRRFGAASTEAPKLFGAFATNKGVERCEDATQPARGIRGRAATLVDAVGFVCNEP
jgi:hypothetical protein